MGIKRICEVDRDIENEGGRERERQRERCKN